MDAAHLPDWNAFREEIGLQLASADVISAVTFVLHRTDDGEHQPCLGIAFNNGGQDRPTAAQVAATIAVVRDGSRMSLNGLQGVLEHLLLDGEDDD